MLTGHGPGPSSPAERDAPEGATTEDVAAENLVVLVVQQVVHVEPEPDLGREVKADVQIDELLRRNRTGIDPSRPVEGIDPAVVERCRQALRAAAGCDFAPSREIELLDQGYTVLRNLEHRMRVVHDQAIHRLPDTRIELDKLARRSGFLDGGVLLEQVERWQHDIRAAYLRLVGA